MRQKFILVGCHAGKTMAIGTHEFVNGAYEFVGTGEQIEGLTRIFALNAALPEHEVSPEVLAELRAAEKGTPTPQKALEENQETDDDGTINVPQVSLQLAEAIGKLDPAVDADWTSNNLPSLDALEKLVGKKVSREEVTAVAEGYTRAKARAARG